MESAKGYIKTINNLSQRGSCPNPPPRQRRHIYADAYVVRATGDTPEGAYCQPVWPYMLTCVTRVNLSHHTCQPVSPCQPESSQMSTCVSIYVNLYHHMSTCVIIHPVEPYIFKHKYCWTPLCVCACVRRACVRACVCACVRECVRVYITGG